MDRHQDVQPVAIYLASHDVDIVRRHLQLLAPCILTTCHTNPHPKIFKAMHLIVRLDRFVTFYVNQNRYLTSAAASCNKHSFLSINLHFMSTTELSDPSMHTFDTLSTLGVNHKVICIASRAHHQVMLSREPVTISNTIKKRVFA